MPPSDPRFFTEEWIITLPSHPKLRFIPMTPTPANFDSWAKICTNPLNHPFDNNKHEVWDEEKLKETKLFKRIKNTVVTSIYKQPH